MVSDAKTRGVNIEHSNDRILRGRNANRHEGKSGELGTMSYTLLSSQRTQDVTCGNKVIELSGTH